MAISRYLARTNTNKSNHLLHSQRLRATSKLPRWYYSKILVGRYLNSRTTDEGYSSNTKQKRYRICGPHGSHNAAPRRTLPASQSAHPGPQPLPLGPLHPPCPPPVRAHHGYTKNCCAGPIVRRRQCRRGIACRKCTFAFVNSPSFSEITPRKGVRKSVPMCCVRERSSAATISSGMYIGAGLNCPAAVP